MKGSDGNFYIVKLDKNDTKKWEKLSKDDFKPPQIRINNLRVGVIKTGLDGEEYKVGLHKGKKIWIKQVTI